MDFLIAIGGFAFFVAIGGGALALLIYFIIKRVEDKKNETFEDRPW